jgi:hypothetical protein
VTVEDNGSPRTTITLGSYQAPGPPTPGATKGLKATRKGSTVTVRWAARPAGFRHAVYLSISDGRRLLRLVPANKTSVSVGGLASSTAVAIRVTSLSPGNTKGPAALVKLKTVKKAKKRKRTTHH